MSNEQVLQQIRHLIGTPYVASVKAYISELTRRPRVIGPNDVSTREVDPNRIHIVVDPAVKITGFNFG